MEDAPADEEIYLEIIGKKEGTQGKKDGPETENQGSLEIVPRKGRRDTAGKKEHAGKERNKPCRDDVAREDALAVFDKIFQVGVFVDEHIVVGNEGRKLGHVEAEMVEDDKEDRKGTEQVDFIDSRPLLRNVDEDILSICGHSFHADIILRRKRHAEGEMRNGKGQ